MPDVIILVQPEIEPPRDLLANVAGLVAVHMGGEMGGQFLEIDPRTEVDITIFRCFGTTQMRSQTDIIMEVAAFDLEERMSNITDRITKIAEGVKWLFGDKHKVSITFIPIKQGHWVAV